MDPSDFKVATVVCWTHELQLSLNGFYGSMHAFVTIWIQSLLFWSERSACDQRSALRWPLFCIINLFFLFFLLLPPLFKTTEEVVVGFQIFARAPKKNNKNSGENIKFAPPPPGPLGGYFKGFLVFF
jgi:hypothetical protein